jgi:hypothetical protein
VTSSLRPGGPCIALALGAALLCRPLPAPADERATGSDATALPGLHRVATMASPEQASVATALGYGFTGAVLDGSDRHHRFLGSLAVAARLHRGLAASLRLDGRHEQHSLLEGSDSGTVLGARLALQGAIDSGAWTLGLRPAIWLPGAVHGASFDLLGGATWRAGALHATANLGFRLDRSGSAVEDADMLSDADRLGLGVSDANALLSAAGLSYRRGTWVWLAEASWDLLLGERAPTASESPLRMAAGLRWLRSQVELGLVVESVVNDYPDVRMGRPLAPVEPRFAGMLVINYRLTGSPGPAQLVPRTGPAPAAPQPVDATVRGQITQDGKPVAGATIHIDDRVLATTDADGRFQLTIRAGSHLLTVRKDGLLEKSLTMAATGGGQLRLDVALEIDPSAIGTGALRGTIQTFGGKPLAATIEIPLRQQQVTCDADGSFELALPAGTYMVRIIAPGYKSQERKVTIDGNGVTILNVNLRRERR